MNILMSLHKSMITMDNLNLIYMWFQLPLIIIVITIKFTLSLIVSPENITHIYNKALDAATWIGRRNFKLNMFWIDEPYPNVFSLI